MKNHKKLIAQMVVVTAFGGCASLDPKPDFDRASRHVEAALGESIIYRPEDEGLIPAQVQALLREGLTVREAVQVCLLNNPRVQAEFSKIGIARADFVQSGLLSNPAFSFAPRWPDGGGLSNLQLGVAQNIAELWQIPFRKRAAEHDLDRVLLEVAREASWAGQEARLAYYRALQAEEAGVIAEENVHLTERLVQLAIDRREAGAGSDVDVNLARAQHADAKLRSRTVSLAVIEARADLVRLLGLSQPPESIVLVEALPQPSRVEFSSDGVIQAAREFRLDWRAARMAVESAAARIDYERSRFLRVVELGVSAERNAQWNKSRGGGVALEGSAGITADGLDPSASLVPQTREPSRSEWVVGPSLNVELPIFDQNQALIAKAEFVHHQAAKMVEAIERDVVRDAHVASARLKTTAENSQLYGEEIVPLREQVLALGEDAYRAGRTSFLSVVQAQQALQEARAGYVAALRDYAASIVEIERVAGGPHERVFRQTPEAQSETAQPLIPETGTPASMPEEIAP